MTAPALTLKVTTIGLQHFTAAQAGADIDLTISHVGFTDQVFVVAPTLTALPGELRRADTVSGALVGDNIVHMTVRDDGDVGYNVRGIGLYLTDGTLLAVYGQADAIVQKSPLSTLFVALDVVFPTGDVTQIKFGDTNFLDPPATTVTKGVARLATAAEVTAGTAPDLIVTPASLAARLLDIVTSLLAAIAHAVADYIPLTQRGAAGGVAQLDAGSKVPAAQLPVGTAGGIAGLDGNARVPVAQLPAGSAGGVAGLDGNAKVPVAQLPAGSAGGVAQLDGNAKVPVAQLPTGSAGGVAQLDAGSKVPVAQLPAGSAGGVASLDAATKVPLGQLPTASANEIKAGAQKVVTADQLAAVWSTGTNAKGRWEKTPVGTIRQYGVVSGSFVEGPQSFDFPIPFPGACECVLACTVNSANRQDSDNWAQVVSLTQTGATVNLNFPKAGGVPDINGFTWVAFGV